MAHLVPKKIRDNVYLSIQRTHYSGNNKFWTEHLEYLGRADRFSGDQLLDAIKFHDNPENKGKKWKDKIQPKRKKR